MNAENKPAVAPAPAPPVETAPQEATLLDGRFGFDLLARLVQAREGDNVMIGPRNIRTALAAAAEGAEGRTREEIVSRAGDYGLIDNAPGASFRNALHIWVPQGKALQTRFLNHFTNARVDSTSPADAPELINTYVSKQTSGKIPSIMMQPPDATGIVLTTVFDFEGKWRYPFNPKATTIAKFFAEPNRGTAARFMVQKQRFRYGESDAGQMVQLPYRDDGLTMTIFLPAHNVSTESWLRQNGNDAWKSLVGALDWREGEVRLPRLRTGYTAQIAAFLSEMGITRAFTEKAEFTGILQDSPPLRIASVTHKSFIAIDEQGTEAAAVTQVGIRAAAMPIGDAAAPFTMTLDRPFLLTIGDIHNDKILFMGVVRRVAAATDTARPAPGKARAGAPGAKSSAGASAKRRGTRAKK
ncbi:MAG: hypothetical protein LBI92_05760 [Azoarcus sp.]|nr:hypothetical protein [Azoarcus sp.]